jgi:hypothetical protein
MGRPFGSFNDGTALAHSFHKEYYENLYGKENKTIKENFLLQ